VPSNKPALTLTETKPGSLCSGLRGGHPVRSHPKPPQWISCPSGIRTGAPPSPPTTVGPRCPGHDFSAPSYLFLAETKSEGMSELGHPSTPYLPQHPPAPPSPHGPSPVHFNPALPSGTVCSKFLPCFQSLGAGGRLRACELPQKF
jgi:hypothetical protein